MARRKGLVNGDPTTWGIKPHWGIPQEVIDLAVNTEGFRIRVVKAAAKRYLERIIWGLTYSTVPAAFVDPQAYRMHAQENLASLPDHPCAEALGQIIEKYIIAAKLEAWLKVNPITITKRRR